MRKMLMIRYIYDSADARAARGSAPIMRMRMLSAVMVATMIMLLDQWLSPKLRTPTSG